MVGTCVAGWLLRKRWWCKYAVHGLRVVRYIIMEVFAIQVYVTILGVSLLSSSFCMLSPLGACSDLPRVGVVRGLVIMTST